MLRALPVIIEIVLLVACLIDAIQSPEIDIRNLPKWSWIVIIVILPVIGPIAWLVAGRPQRARRSSVPWPTTRTSGFPEYERPPKARRAPDDDPAFLASLKNDNAEHEKMLKQWEADLKRREEELRKQPDSDDEQP